MIPPARDNPLTRKLGSFVTLSAPDLDILADLHGACRPFPVGADMIFEGQAQRSAYILCDGWASSYKLLPDGTRQILDFQIPGDFLGVSSALFRTADYNIEPVTAVEASVLSASDLVGYFERSPQLATAMLWAAARDQATILEHLINIGRRDALRRTAHILLELGARLMLVGLGTRGGYDCPLSQYLLADALGLSAVHVNRVLRKLRERGLLTFRDGRVTFEDYDRLVELAEFDVSYLDQGGPLLR